MTGLVTIATVFWEPNDKSFSFSRMYDERWVEKLYRGVARNTSRHFRFVCFSDADREYTERDIVDLPLSTQKSGEEPDYRCCIEPYKLNTPMILMGLDTVITGNIDALMDYCLTGDRIALPRDPFFPDKLCNGVALVPRGQGWIYEQFLASDITQRTASSDMEFMRENASKFAVIDDLFPGRVVSYKGAVKDYGPDDARIVYFHGEQKPHEIADDWLPEHWR